MNLSKLFRPKELFASYRWRLLCSFVHACWALPLHWCLYWGGALVPKKTARWAFTAFRNRVYSDNTKYLYEYAAAHHPELECVWLTSEPAIEADLKQRGLPVLRTGTWRAAWWMLRARLAVTDHYFCTDYLSFFGFNAGTRRCQLWHGVGLKSMTPQGGPRIPSCMDPRVRLSPDLLAQPGDSLLRRIGKAVKYAFVAPFREWPEQYFAFLVPGPERIKSLLIPWHTPLQAAVHAGNPRNLHLTEQQPVPGKILYAPTLRWNAEDKQTMMAEFIAVLPQMQALMEEIGGTFVYRPHPSVRASYADVLTAELAAYPRIVLDEGGDIYTCLGTYAMVISDYSSIAFDFVLLDRPCIFHVPDLERFVQTDVPMNYPFEEFTPGPKTRTWAETMAAIRRYHADPQADSESRCSIRSEFYDMEVNDAANSARIITALKQRLGMID